MRKDYKLTKGRLGGTTVSNVTLVLNEFEIDEVIKRLQYSYRQLKSISGWANSLSVKLTESLDEDESEDVLAQLDAIEYTSDNLATIIDWIFGLRMADGEILSLQSLQFELKKVSKSDEHKKSDGEPGKEI